jgi:hypothetical protein
MCTPFSLEDFEHLRVVLFQLVFREREKVISSEKVAV